MFRVRPVRTLALLSFAAVSASGFAAQNALAAAKETAPAFAPIEFPSPGKSTIERDKTIVVGSAAQWFGTLSMDSDSDLNTAQQFYSGAMTSQGCQPLSALIADRVVLQFIDRQRARSIMISIDKKGGLTRGTHIEVVISPLIQGAL